MNKTSQNLSPDQSSNYFQNTDWTDQIADHKTIKSWQSPYMLKIASALYTQGGCSNYVLETQHGLFCPPA